MDAPRNNGNSDMKCWIFVFNPLERYMSDYRQIFDAWEEGGSLRHRRRPHVLHAGGRHHGSRLPAGPEGLRRPRTGPPRAGAARPGEGEGAQRNARRRARPRLARHGLRQRHHRTRAEPRQPLPPGAGRHRRRPRGRTTTNWPGTMAASSSRSATASAGSSPAWGSTSTGSSAASPTCGSASTTSPPTWCATTPTAAPSPA